MHCGSTIISAYGGKAGAVCLTHGSTGGGTLPFTGQNLLFIALLALVLIAFGIATWRAAK